MAGIVEYANFVGGAYRYVKAVHHKDPVLPATAIKKMREAKTAAVDILAKAKVAAAKVREDAQDK